MRRTIIVFMVDLPEPFGPQHLVTPRGEAGIVPITPILMGF